MMRWSAFFLLAWLVGCAGGGGDSGGDPGKSAQQLLPTQQIEVVLQMTDAPPALRRSLAGFSEANGIDLRIEAAPEQRPTLAELNAGEFAQWLHAGRLSPLPDALVGLAQSARGADGARWEGEQFGIPWRVRPVALVVAGDVEAPPDWPSLQSLQQQLGAWGSEASALAPSLLSFVASGSGIFDAAEAPPLDTDAWSEALSFLTRSLPLEQVCASDELERRFVSGAIAIATTDPGQLRRLRQLQPQRPLTLAPFPPLEAEAGQARVALEARFLVLPRSGAYPDLAAALARELFARAGEFLSAAASGFLPANPAAEFESPDAEAWEALLAAGFAVAPFPGRAEWDSALLHAIQQSVDRKRNPAQALADAQAEFERGQE